WMRTPLSLAPGPPPEPRQLVLSSVGRLITEPSCKKTPPRKVLKQWRFHGLPLQQLACRFFQQVPQQLAGSGPKALFDRLIAHMKVQCGDHMIELRITGRGVIHPAQHTHLHKLWAVYLRRRA